MDENDVDWYCKGEKLSSKRSSLIVFGRRRKHVYTVLGADDGSNQDPRLVACGRVHLDPDHEQVCGQQRVELVPARSTGFEKNMYPILTVTMISGVARKAEMRTGTGSRGGRNAPAFRLTGNLIPRRVLTMGMATGWLEPKLT